MSNCKLANGDLPHREVKLTIGYFEYLVSFYRTKAAQEADDKKRAFLFGMAAGIWKATYLLRKAGYNSPSEPEASQAEESGRSLKYVVSLLVTIIIAILVVNNGA